MDKRVIRTKRTIKDIANNLNIKVFQVENTLKLLEEGSTIPFIARYRKEATSGLDEKKIKEISDVYKYQVNLLKRKEDVIRLIDEKNLLTEELKNKILSCNSKILNCNNKILNCNNKILNCNNKI